MHVLVQNGEIAQYPYTNGNLRRDNPSTSFPKDLSDAALANWGMYPVSKTERPTTNHTQNVVEGTPVLIDGVWTQVWSVSDATADEVAGRIEQASNNARSERDYLLSESDWRVIKAQETGVALSGEWVTYRQALRDITSHANWPYLNDSDWPTKPE